MIEDPRIRQISSPVKRKMLSPLDPRCQVVQFSSLPSDRELKRIATFMERYPDVALRAYGGYDGSIDDLEFLRFFPQLRRFRADALRYNDLTSIDGLRFLPDDLVELSLGQTRRRFSLEPVARFRSLRTLSLDGQTKGIEVIAGLSALEDVTLRSITLPDLSLLIPLRRLRSLDLKLGGTRDLSLLPQLAPLVYLELWMIRGLDDISAVGQLPSLQYLFLQDLARVHRLPDMSAMVSLRRILIQNLKGLTDLSPLRSAPALEELEVYESRHLKPEHFTCLVGHPTLRHAVAGLGSKKKNDAVRHMLGLDRPPGAFIFR